jgi:hypothetical protein
MTKRRSRLRSIRAAVVLAGLIAGLGAVSVTAAPVAQPGPIWPAASEVQLPADAVTTFPHRNGVYVLGGPVMLYALTCTSPGNCTAVGSYEDTNDTATSSDYQAMYVSESAGVWGRAQRVSLPSNYSTRAALQNAYLDSIACTSPGNCVAVGGYDDGGGADSASPQAMILTETAGSWGRAAELTPPTQAHNGGLSSVACVSAGNCVAVGEYTGTDAGSNESEGRAMVVAEVAGAWGTATEVRLPANANTTSNQQAILSSVSCTPVRRHIGPLYRPGDCVAVGSYVDATNPGNDLAMVTSESGGSWSQAAELKRPADSSSTQSAVLLAANRPSVSCTSPGNCVAVGAYSTAADSIAAMAATASGGTWAQATPVGAPADAGTDHPFADLDAVTCTSPGNCVAVGQYADSNGASDQAMVTAEVGGHWTAESKLTLPPVLASAPGSQVASLSGVACTDATTCVAAGGYTDSPGQYQAMVVATVAPLAVASTSLPAGMVGSSYNTTLKASGGAGTYTWARQSGSLPAGLTLNASTGVISGTPTTAGTSNFTVAVSEPDLAPAGQQATAALSIAILARPSSSGGSTSHTGTPSITKVAAKNPKVIVTVACAGNASESCTGTLTLSALEHLRGHKITAISAAKTTKRTVTLGRAAYTVTAGASGVFTISLNATAKRLLATHHHFAARLTLTPTGAKTATATKTITLRR